MSSQRRPQGRPPATSHAAIEAAAFELFAKQGFDETTTGQIADAAGIARRTLFRYFPSKSDIPWGQFDRSLSRLQESLDMAPADAPVVEVIQGAVIEFNRLESDAIGQHRQRMMLILTTPALQAHSVLRYQQWRSVISDFAARRYGLPTGSLLPRTIGQVSLALALSAYEQWLKDDGRALEELLDAALSHLRSYVIGDPPG